VEVSAVRPRTRRSRHDLDLAREWRRAITIGARETALAACANFEPNVEGCEVLAADERERCGDSRVVELLLANMTPVNGAEEKPEEPLARTRPTRS
jgi:hypothetical protein